ncbi:MAG TPA: tRNA (adenosine(37)-N6)-dimethylallyltransferase MiaA [Pirellulales bacterium]|jgi:tRNA dimethylallyltransferase|nr:tRNA (adenosine(37)-N6)-dimethylallyltransferase MiaA [Pirellulales bacterium]
MLPSTGLRPLASGPCVVLAGPTGGGKSAVGIELAQRIDGEIISLDSMAVYRGMNIGTAKPSEADRRLVPHHLIDIVDPWEDFSVAQYLDAAGDAVREIRARNRLPVFVGGTPLYLKALLRGLFSGPAADWDLRRQLAEVARQSDAAELHRRLAAVDPAAAAKLHPNDVRRLIRALEVFHHTGRLISEQQRQFNEPPIGEPAKVFVLDWPREKLHQRIEKRVDAMFAAGLVDEVRALISIGHGRSLSRTAGQAVGYREILAHLAGDTNLATTVDLVKLHTRQFAKRQLTWFRSLHECRWIPMAEPLLPGQVAAKIASSAV